MIALVLDRKKLKRDLIIIHCVAVVGIFVHIYWSTLTNDQIILKPLDIFFFLKIEILEINLCFI